MTKVYKVWIEVEEYDTETDEGTTLADPCDFASTATFDTIEEAEGFARSLHRAGERGDLYCEHGKPENPGPCSYCVGGE